MDRSEFVIQSDELWNHDKLGQIANGNHHSEIGGKNMLMEKVAPASLLELGYEVRAATMNDLEVALELFDICSINMIGKSEHSLSDMRTEWLLPEFDLQTTTQMIFSPEGRLVGYIEVWDIDEPPVRNWVWGCVHPDYQGRGLGTHLMEWAENKLQLALAKAPSNLRVTMEAGTDSNFAPAKELLKSQGMQEVRSFHTMVIDLEEMPPEPHWVNGITVRTMKGIDEARDVIWAIEDAFRDHWGYVQQPFETELKHWLHFMKNDDQYDPSIWFLAMEDDEIVGVASCREKSNQDPDMAWVSTLGVRKSWRKRGIALALLHHSFREFYRRGKARVGLGVDVLSLTGATRLYEKAGMHPVLRFDVFEKELRPGKDIVRRTLDD
jgi:mycothiol synthase